MLCILALADMYFPLAPTGKGLTVSDTVACVLDCFGITDVVSKCHGQRNPFTVIKATFNALSKHQSAEEIALKTGHSLVEISKLARSRNL
jgi:small subunit ribosomal protein S5